MPPPLTLCYVPIMVINDLNYSNYYEKLKHIYIIWVSINECSKMREGERVKPREVWIAWEEGVKQTSPRGGKNVLIFYNTISKFSNKLKLILKHRKEDNELEEINPDLRN